MDPYPLMLRSMARTFELQGLAAPGGRALKFDGITASITPTAPERSVVNSVVVQDFARLDAAALHTLASAYAEAGVGAWTVWVPEGTVAARELLEMEGHVLDASPAAMLLQLGKLRPARVPEPAEWSSELDIEAAGRVNDAAYGDEPGLFARAIADLPEDAAHMYLARTGGDPAAFVLVHDWKGDCVFWIAATIPAARRHGLVSWLLHRALLDARERGCTTSTTQASRLGATVYERLGYRTVGRMEMWERRVGRPDVYPSPASFR